MSLLDCPAAERDRGLCLDLDLSRPGDISAQRGVVTGALSWDAVRGARFDGTNDSVAVPFSSQIFDSGFWSLVLVFWPEFTPGDLVTRYLWSAATATNSLAIDTDGTMFAKFGGANILAAYATYSAYWKTNQRNVLVMVGRNTSQSWYLNGNLFKSNNAAFTSYTYTTLTIGATSAGTSKFLGSISSIKFFRHNSAAELLTAQEASDYYHNKSFNYMSRASCILPLTAACHEPSHATQTTDVDQTEKLVDGDMEAVGIAAWTVGGAGAVVQKVPGARTGGSGTQVLQIIRAGAQATATQTILTIGVKYRVTGWARGDGVASWPRVGTSAGYLWSGTTSATWQYCDFVFTAAATGLFLTNHTDDGTCEFDDFSVKIAVNLLSDGAMEQFDTDQWTAGNAATLTKSTTTPYQGTQCLRITYGGVNSPYAGQTIFTVGKRYRISGAARGNGVYFPYVADTTGAAMWIGTVSTSWQTFSIDVTLTQTQLRLFSSANAAGYVEFDNMSVVEMRARTLDASGRGNNLILGDGSTVSTMPTKLGVRGYSLDGGDYFKQENALGLTGDFSILWVGRFDYSARCFLWSLRNAVGTDGLAVDFTPTALRVLHNSGVSAASLSSTPVDFTTQHLGFVFDSVTRKASIYYNGKYTEQTAALTVASGYNSGVWLGARYSGTDKMTGRINGFVLTAFAMTPLQVADHYRATMQQIGAV